MIHKKTVLAIIPARGGSKGVPKKNIQKVGGKSLLEWTAQEAGRSKYIDRLVLSSEDAEIIQLAKKCGIDVPFVRPMELTQDDSPASEAVLHALQMLPGYDYVVLLQPTSPLRIAADIDGCLEMTVAGNSKSCISVTETDKSPYWMCRLDNNNILHPLIPSESPSKRRQEYPPVYLPNGAVYLADTNFFLTHRNFKSESTIGYKMPRERSLDIDTELDFIVCESILQNRGDNSLYKNFPLTNKRLMRKDG